MAVKVCKALSAAISLCCKEPGTCQCRRVRLRLRRVACMVHTLSPIELQSLSSPSSREILAECPPFICSPRQSSSTLLHILHPRNGHSSDPLISLHISLHFIHSFYVFSQSCILTPSACWVVDYLKYLEVCRHFIIPQELGDQLFRLRNVI